MKSHQTKNKLQKLWEKSQQNEIELNKKISSIDSTNVHNSVLKHESVIYDSGWLKFSDNLVEVEEGEEAYSEINTGIIILRLRDYTIPWDDFTKIDLEYGDTNYFEHEWWW